MRRWEALPRVLNMRGEKKNSDVGRGVIRLAAASSKVFVRDSQTGALLSCVKSKQASDTVLPPFFLEIPTRVAKQAGFFLLFFQTSLLFLPVLGVGTLVQQELGVGVLLGTLLSLSMHMGDLGEL